MRSMTAQHQTPSRPMGSTHSATPSNIIPAAPLVHDENRLPHLSGLRAPCLHCVSGDAMSDWNREGPGRHAFLASVLEKYSVLFTLFGLCLPVLPRIRQSPVFLMCLGPAKLLDYQWAVAVSFAVSFMAWCFSKASKPPWKHGKVEIKAFVS